MNEEWRVIPGFGEKYEASSIGRIRVIATGHIKGTTESRGYLRATLYHQGRWTRRVHQLVAAAFLGPRPEGMEVRHLDGDRKRNVPGNLAYGTHAENVRDQVTHGTARNGRAERTHCPRGHAYTPENTYLNGSTRKRSCKTCVHDRYRRKLKARAAATSPMEEE